MTDGAPAPALPVGWLGTAVGRSGPVVPVLLVNDNPAKRLALRAVLAPLGYRLVEADSGRAALRCILAEDFAVILLDVRMPDMDGFETAALIRQRRQSETTPIIFITAHADSEVSPADRYAEGAVDFIFAPFPADELRAKVAVFARLFTKAALLAEQAGQVRSAMEQLRLLTEAAPIGIFQTDSENRYLYTNRRWSQLTGIPPERAVGRPLAAFTDATQRSAFLRELAVAAGSREVSHRFTISPDSGGDATSNGGDARRAGERVLMLTARVVPAADGGTTGWIGTLADITAEAGAEASLAVARDAADEASRQKSDFLATMSHEIRTPMNGVIGMTDLLLQTDLDHRQRDYAETVQRSGEALLTIIDDILDFSKVEAGKLHLEHVDFSFSTVVEDVVDLLAAPAQRRGLELMAVVAPSVPALVRGDPGRVRQVLLNLVGNAIKFTGSGEVVVRVAATPTAAGTAEVAFEVTDTGEGVAPEKLDTIFQPFVQADTSTSRRHGGTGLGLAISARLVDLMGGRCRVTSRLGAGSTFTFTVIVDTVTPGADAVPADPVATAVPSSARLRGVRALVVDDNATQREIVGSWLAEWGMVPTLTGPADALDILRGAAARGEPLTVAIVARSVAGRDGLPLASVLGADPDLDLRLLLLTDLGHGADRARQVDASAAPPVAPLPSRSATPTTFATLSKPIHRSRLLLSLLALLEPAADGETGRSTTAPAPPAPPSPLASLPASLPVRPPAAPGTPAVARRLLLAEDNLINQKVAVAMLTDAGYTVDPVPDGTAAVAAAATRHYDAILMDCHMPDLNGYEATGRIRAEEGAGRHTPIIALTAGARPEDRERCLTAGMDAYLAKPIRRDRLLAVVADLVRPA